MMLKLTSQIENVFRNISDVIGHVLETKRKKNTTEFSYNLQPMIIIIWINHEPTGSPPEANEMVCMGWRTIF